MGQDIRSRFERYEKKFMLTPSQYEFIKAHLKEHMVPDAYPRYSLCNIYYDTPDFQLIRTSLDKPIYKEKLRVRSYGVPTSDTQIFVELKKKFKGEVFKRRTILSASEASSWLNDGVRPSQPDQVCREVDWFLKSYAPSPQIFIAYEREAFAGRDDKELRLTFDTNLRWRDTDLDLRLGDHGEPILRPEQILMEVKIPGAAPVWLAHLLSEGHIFMTSFSKYGTCYRENLMLRGEKTTEKAVRYCA